jgi:hypothetical protein
MGSSKFKDEVQRVELVDIFGELVFSREVYRNSDPVEIDISHLSAGIYFVKISFGNSIITERIVKVSHR